uniref:F5/8 type C domain-containing protein n=1 Tax=Strigops habroptila TaxID=2489341 RepID=A0A672UBV4_STRHB
LSSLTSRFSKNLTKAGSFSKDARICSKLLSSCPSLGISAGTSIMATGLLTGDVGLCSLLTASSIFSRRLVTTAIARYNSSSSGSPWNRLYRVLEKWMN